MLSSATYRSLQALSIAQANPFRYRSYYFDTETVFYYLPARYYDPAIGRFISQDDYSYLDPETINGLNLFAYCLNNPVMNFDPSGHFTLPKWAAWVISGLAVVGGIVLCATGVGGALGGVLIGAGVGSLVNGYINEANGGSFTAGYIGGAISGALCGLGAGFGGAAFVAAANASSALAGVGYLALGVATSFAGGFAGNMAGTFTTSKFDNSSADIDWQETIRTSVAMGVLNIFAGAGSYVSGLAGNLGKEITNAAAKSVLRIGAGVIAGGTEAFYDLGAYLIAKIAELLQLIRG